MFCVVSTRTGLSHAVRNLLVCDSCPTLLSISSADTGYSSVAGDVLWVIQCKLLQVTLASDFMWNWNQREPSASFGYDYMLRQCRLRGKIDTDGKVGAYLEERVNVGVNFILSAELDHPKKDYKFGFGMTVGE